MLKVLKCPHFTPKFALCHVFKPSVANYTTLIKNSNREKKIMKVLAVSKRLLYYPNSFIYLYSVLQNGRYRYKKKEPPFVG